MSIEAARVAFLHAAAGGLRLEKFLLGYDKNSRQFLTVTGWHADGAPFATTTATFEGNPIVRGAQLARDVISAHQGSSGGGESRPATTQPTRGALNAASISCDGEGREVGSIIGKLGAGLAPGPLDPSKMNEMYRLLAAQAALEGGKLKGNALMSQKGSGLARLVGGLRDFDSKADALATRLEQAMARMESAIPVTEQIVGNVEKGAGDLENVNALYSNGTPPNPTPGS
jgi:hypothetical protein